MRVLVTGATEYIGGRLVPRLLAVGHDVRCLARTPSRLAGRPWASDPRAEIVAGDAFDAASLERALHPLHQVVFSGLIDAILRRAEAGARR